MFVFIQLSYASFSGASGVSFLDGLAIMSYNVVIAGAACAQVCDRDGPVSSAVHCSEQYGLGRRHRGLSWNSVLYWLILACFHAALVFGIFFCLVDTVTVSGRPLSVEQVAGACFFLYTGMF